jgi:hypothetical protein
VSPGQSGHDLLVSSYELLKWGHNGDRGDIHSRPKTVHKWPKWLKQIGMVTGEITVEATGEVQSREPGLRRLVR